MLQQRSNVTRSKRRLWVIVYYAVVVILGIVWGRALWHHSKLIGILLPILFPVSYALGGLNAAGPVRPFSRWYDTSPPAFQSLLTPLRGVPVDERDLAVRDHAHYAAYSAVRALGFLCAVVMVVFFVIDSRWVVPLAASLLYPAYALLMSLPQAILLWTEPDPAPESPTQLAGAPQ